MRDERLDRITVAGLFIALFIMTAYVAYDYIDKNRPDLSFLSPDVSVNMAFPNVQLPSLSLDWFYTMDPVSKILFCFLVTVVSGSGAGCVWLLLKYGRNRAQH